MNPLASRARQRPCERDESPSSYRENRADSTSLPLPADPSFSPAMTSRGMTLRDRRATVKSSPLPPAVALSLPFTPSRNGVTAKRRRRGIVTTSGPVSRRIIREYRIADSFSRLIYISPPARPPPPPPPGAKIALCGRRRLAAPCAPS